MTVIPTPEAARARFLALLDAYGADASRWPEDAAEELAPLWADPTLAPAIAEARALDQLLGEEAQVALHPSFVARLTEAARPKPQRQSWRPLAALAACALLGIGVGASLGPSLLGAAGQDPVVWADEIVSGWEDGG